MTNKIENLDVFYEAMNQTITYTIITHDDGSQTSMPKADYDAQQAAQATLPSNFVGIGNAPADPTA